MLTSTKDDDHYYIDWRAEPGALKIHLYPNSKDKLQISVREYEDENKLIKDCNEEIPTKDFIEAIVYESFRVLKIMGLNGYRQSWLDNTDFPLGKLTLITGEISLPVNGCCSSDLSVEMNIIANHVDKFKNTEATCIDEATVYYESWQIQCCGKPFSVGDEVEWTIDISKSFRNAHGTLIDFEEEHHIGQTHSITGKVIQILAEWSEFPRGQHEINYDRTSVNRSEITTATGWEYTKDTNDIALWGYIVKLENVIIKPLE